MDRISSMARFDGPDEVEPKVVAKCEGPYCGNPIYEGEEHILREGTKRYCGITCMKDSIDFEWVTEGGEE